MAVAFNRKIFHQFCLCNNSMSSKRYIFNRILGKKYKGEKVVKFTCQQMYDVVSDVSKYETFIPYCTKSIVETKNSTLMKARLDIGFPPITSSYLSIVNLEEPRLVKAVCNDTALFHHLAATWRFLPYRNNKACIVKFDLDFQFRSIMHATVTDIFFDDLLQKIQKAFETEASKRYLNLINKNR